MGYVRQHLQVRPDSGTHDEEDGLDRLLIGRAERYRLSQIRHTHGRGGAGSDNRLPYVRNRDSVTDPRRHDVLASNQDFDEELSIEARGYWRALHNRTKSRVAVRIWHIVVDPAHPERLRQAGSAIFEIKVRVEGLERDWQSTNGRPFEEVGSVEPHLIADTLKRNLGLVYPPVDLSLGTREQRRSIAYGQEH